jgi:hypothetical protein
MMVPKKSLILAGAALALFGATAGAQTNSNKLLKRAGGSVKQVTLDLGTGTYTRGPVANNRGGTTIADFQNIDAFDGAGFGWISVDTGGTSCRWFSAASKGAAPNQSSNNSDLMTDVVFFYCSNALDVASGGVGGSVTLGFYEGYTIFGGAPTTTVAQVALTGMPANTSQGSWFSAGAGCFGLRVTFPTMVPFADNVFIGYSWQFDDTGTDGTLGNTYPFITCVVSCSGLSLFTQPTAGGVGGPLGLGEDGQGMINAWDQFCTAPLISHTFAFGTVTPAFAPDTYSAFNMQIQEAGDLATTNANYNATLTPNADTLSATKATLGTTWTCTVTRAAVSAAGTFVVTVKKNKSLPNGTPAVAPVQGRILTGGTQLTQITGAHNGVTGTITSGIPLSFAFCGLHFAAQGRLTGGGIKLSSANEGTIGTF